jgi:hypothetical protein
MKTLNPIIPRLLRADAWRRRRATFPSTSHHFSRPPLWVAVKLQSVPGVQRVAAHPVTRNSERWFGELTITRREMAMAAEGAIPGVACKGQSGLVRLGQEKRV